MGVWSSRGFPPPPDWRDDDRRKKPKPKPPTGGSGKPLPKSLTELLKSSKETVD